MKKMIYASSSSIFGNPVKPMLNEEHPQNPTSPYGVSKLANEKYASIFREVHGLEITSLRYGIVYGPREWFGRVLTASSLDDVLGATVAVQPNKATLPTSRRPRGTGQRARG